MDTQIELERLRAEIAELRKALGNKQQLPAPTLPSLHDNFELIADCARYSEGLTTEAAVRKKHHFDEATWEALGNDTAFLERIEAEKLRRVRDGSLKRERAQNHVVKAPDILNTIMSDPKANARHKVDAIKCLDSLADPQSPTAHDDTERVCVTINLGADHKLMFNKPVKPSPNDPDDSEIIDVTPPVPGFAI